VKQLSRQRSDGFTHGGIDLGGVAAVRELKQQHVASGPLDQRAIGLALLVHGTMKGPSTLFRFIYCAPGIFVGAAWTHVRLSDRW
jgi:hypothetical protein